MKSWCPGTTKAPQRVAYPLVLISLSACSLISGLSELEEVGGERPHKDMGSTSTSSSSAGGGGADGGYAPTECGYGETRPCYPGPEGTEGIGACKAGVEGCIGGSWSGVCTGAVLPAPEVCGNSLDEDCDGADTPATSCLVDTGLLVRYFIDEASEGQGPGQLQDAAPAPLPLDIDYEFGLSFTEVNGHRGLVTDSSDGSRVWSYEAGKVRNALDSSTTFTVELVVEPGPLVMTSNDQFLLQIGYTDGIVLRRSDNGMFMLRVNQKDVAEWDMSSYERVVVHATVDTDAPQPDTVRVYLNGDEQQQSGSLTLSPIDLLDPLLILGNRYPSGNGYTFHGTIYYAAVYAEALTPEEVATNANLLLIDDDGPGVP